VLRLVSRVSNDVVVCLDDLILWGFRLVFRIRLLSLAEGSYRRFSLYLLCIGLIISL
jgi:hypothetical protein